MRRLHASNSPASCTRLVLHAGGNPPAKVLTAVQNFCREEFALKHRYALALHTDEPHPHVHVVIKAASEQGERLNIRKEMHRQWRSDFARHLRAVGVSANATTDTFVARWRLGSQMASTEQACAANRHT